MADELKFSIPRRKYYKVFACPECDNSRKRFNNLRDLNIHGGRVHPEKNTTTSWMEVPKFSIPRIKYYVACPECGNSKKTFKTLRDLNIHSRIVHPGTNIKYFPDKKGHITSRPRTPIDIKSIIHNDPSFKKWLGET